jgi:6-phosphogluconate dehydrogenase/gluconokinase
MLLVVCGVSGSGKTTIGKLLSEALDIPFHDADDFHPALNVEKMANGQPLDDADRQPWLEELALRLSEWQEEGGAVLACSALKESYRATLESQCDENIRWVFLTASEKELVDRLASRKGHFFDRNLLASQFEALEIPGYRLRIDTESPRQEIVDAILKKLHDE